MYGHLNTRDMIGFGVIVGLPATFFLVGAAGNLITAWNQLVRRVWSGSMIFVVPGTAGMIAAIACPVRTVRMLAWLPLILDVGCVPLLVYYYVVVPLAQRAAFVGHTEAASVFLNLYRSGTYTLTRRTRGDRRLVCGRGTWSYADGSMCLHDGRRIVTYHCEDLQEGPPKQSARLIWVSGESDVMPDGLGMYQVGGRSLMRS